MLCCLVVVWQVHDTVFVNCLKALCSSEQLETYLPKALAYQIIGAYAQTELGHGSNIGGILTTATYVPKEDCFDLHTPCLQATKWWVGGLGQVISAHDPISASLVLTFLNVCHNMLLTLLYYDRVLLMQLCSHN